MAVPFQRYAIDIVDVPPGRMRFKEALGQTNEDFRIWNRPILCPVDGEVIEAIDGVRDNERIGSAHCYSYSALGNAYVIRAADRRFMVFAHLKQGSLLFRSGQSVRRGDVIGCVGNSGQSTEPHLHFHIQNHPWPGKGVGVRFAFSNVEVNGSFLERYEPQRGHYVKNEK
jgi:murein DD-endopeptidase MepM/ murein hydrolase activator NlpD